MPSYAEFLVDVVEHFNDEGIFFGYLSPINEPQWDWGDDEDQEGMPALNEEIYSLVKYLSAELTDRKPKTRIILGEAGTIGHASLSMKSLGIGMNSDGRDNQAAFFFSPASPFFIGDLSNVEKIISAHSYFSVWPVKNQVRYRYMVRSALERVDPHLGYWMSEYCPLQPNDELAGLSIQRSKE